MKRIGMCLASGLAIVLSGCVEEQLEQKVTPPTVNEGEVAFGARVENLSDTPQTRTIYGEPDDYDNYGELTINWLADQDQVRVYSPQASEECRSADYTVMSTTADGGSGFYLQKNGEVGVRWGDVSQPHEFYAFYPSVVEDGTGGVMPISGLDDAKGTVVTANIPVAQEKGSIQTKTNGGVTWKIVTPNMTYAMMAGKGTWSPTVEEGDPSPKNVSLTFEPIVLVLDVVINAGDTDYKILGVSVRSKTQPIVGDFTYDIANGDFNYTSSSSDDNNQAWVDCQEDGQALTLSPREKLNVKFFLLPRDIKASELTVSVLLENGQTLSQALVPSGSNDDAALVHGKIIKVRTPKINPAQESNWMSMIGNDVLFASQLSLPGSKHSYTYLQYASETDSYNANTGIMQAYQHVDMTIEKQFNAGIRAFNVKLDAYNNTPHVYVGGRSLTNVPLSSLLNEIKEMLDAVPTEFVVLSIDYVQDDNSYSFQTWLNTICSAINTWSYQNPRSDTGEDGTDLNNGDTDYFREVTATTTVGTMRHGIGVMIHCPPAGGDNPSYNSSHVNVITNYSTSVQNTGLVEYNISNDRGFGHITIQDLQQVNNPSLLSDYADVGLCPYFITEAYALNGASLDLIQTKKDLINDLFTLSRENNAEHGELRTNNLYVNDLSCFCVVNNNESTGSAQYRINEYYQGNWGIIKYWKYGSWSTVTDYASIPTAGSYYATTLYHSDTEKPSEPSGASNGDRWLEINAGNYDRGQGGNNALAAEQINGAAADLIYNLVNEGRTPLGVVYMSFAGVDQVTFGGRTYNVSGVRLPSLIMSNNFKFALATSGDTNGASGYDSDAPAIQ